MMSRTRNKETHDAIFRRDQTRTHDQTMELLRQLYGQPAQTPQDYARDAMAPPDEDEDCTDAG